MRLPLRRGTLNGEHQMTINPLAAGASVGSRARRSATRRGTRPRHTEQIVLKFDAESDHLPPTERVVLERWIGRWLIERPQGVVVMGLTGPRGEGVRRTARLRGLRDCVQALGVTRENIKYTERPVALARREVGSDAVVLKIMEPPPEGQQVRSVASCFDLAAPSS